MECTFKVVIFNCYLDIFHEIGLLQSSEIFEVHRSDLVPNFVGDTANKTEEKIKQAFRKVVLLLLLLLLLLSHALTSKFKKDYGKEAIGSLMRYVLPSTESVQHPVFIFVGYNENIEKFLDMNLGFRKITLKFIFQDYSLIDLSSITLSKLLTCKNRFPFGVKIC